MFKVDQSREITAYRGSHVEFRHEYNEKRANFAVRRVHCGQPNEHVQMETCLSTRHKTRTSEQHMSVCMTPAEARAFALQIAPELGEALDVVHAILQQQHATALPDWLVSLAQQAWAAGARR